MRKIETSKVQMIVNKIISKQNFTEFLETPTNGDYRYIVGAYSIFRGNPNEFENLSQTIEEELYLPMYDTIGGWYDEEAGEYHVDLGFVYRRLDIALEEGKYYKQKAIYDLVNKKEITIKY